MTPRRRPSRRSHRAGRTIAGALLAITLIAGGYGAYVYVTLPDVTPLKTKNPTTTAFMALREQEYRHRDGRTPRKHQQWVPISRVSQHLIDAVLLAEDAGFYHHDGVDYHELWESMKINWRTKKIRRGASTITQQLAKNLYLSSERTLTRKFRELLITRRLEEDLSKRRILELYLNVVEWGPHLYGVEQAARTYFGVSARNLTPAQSATLAGMLINPIRHTPLAPTSRLARRKRIILDRMVRYNKITQEEYRIALGLPSPEPDRPVQEPIPVAEPAPLPEPPDDGLAEDEPTPDPPITSVPPLELTEPLPDPPTLSAPPILTPPQAAPAADPAGSPALPDS